jgi:hypothetical protein
MESEIIELNFDDNFDNFDKSDWNDKPSTNFGGGLELLMNGKVKDQKYKGTEVNLEDLNNLEDELNDLVNNDSSYRPKSDLFSANFDDFSGDNKDTSKKNTPMFSLGKSTAEQQTWDGYSKFNNIPVNPDVPKATSKGPEDSLKEKFKYLKKLTDLEKKGIELSKKYNMESSLFEMQGEYDTIMEDIAKKQSIKFQNSIFTSIINGIEFLNGRFDPFDIKLDGLSEQINENIETYDDIFGELHEKYKNRGSMAPELKLLFQLGGSAMMVHFTNTMFKSAAPGVDDVFRQNPDLMRAFQAAAVNSMATSNPGFAGFMNNLSGNGLPSSSQGPPPPMATQPTKTPYYDNYPTGPSQKQANSPYIGQKNNNFIDTRADFQDKNYSRQQGSQSFPSSTNGRPDMKGPTDISHILSGLKTKNINIRDPSGDDNNSTISMNDLKDIDSSANLPKKSRRKKSASNTVSLDI